MSEQISAAEAEMESEAARLQQDRDALKQEEAQAVRDADAVSSGVNSDGEPSKNILSEREEATIVEAQGILDGRKAYKAEHGKDPAPSPEIDAENAIIADAQKAIEKQSKADPQSANAANDMGDAEDELNDLDDPEKQRRNSISNPAAALSSFIFNHKGPSGNKGSLVDLVLKYREKIPENDFNAVKSAAQDILDHNYSMLTERPPAHEAAKKIDEMVASSKDGTSFEDMLANAESNAELNATLQAMMKEPDVSMAEVKAQVQEAHDKPLNYQNLALEVVRVQEHNAAYADLSYEQVIAKEVENATFRRQAEAAMADDNKLAPLNEKLQTFVDEKKSKNDRYKNKSPQEILAAELKHIPESKVDDYNRKLKQDGPAESETSNFKTSAKLYEAYADKANTYAASADKHGVKFEAGLKAINEEVVKRSKTMQMSDGEESKKMDEVIERVRNMVKNLLKMVAG